MGIHHLAESVVHTAVEGEGIMANRILGSRFPTLVTRLHINARTKRCATVGGGAYTALDIERGHAAGHIGHIDPKDSLTLAIVERDIIERHVDTGVIGTTDAEIGVPYSQSVVAGSHESRRSGKQKGKILPRVALVELLIGELGVVVSDLRYWRVDDDLIQLSGEGDGVGLRMCNDTCRQSGGEKEREFFHTSLAALPAQVQRV